MRKVGGILERHIRIRIVVASETILRRRQMGRQRLSGSDIAVMALHAIVGDYTCVIKGRIGKVRGVMAIDAILGIGIGWYVIKEFTDANPVVVTGVATAINTSMIIGPGRKRARGMANTAIQQCRHVGI